MFIGFFFFSKRVDINYVTDTPVIFHICNYFDKSIWSQVTGITFISPDNFL